MKNKLTTLLLSGLLSLGFLGVFQSNNVVETKAAKVEESFNLKGVSISKFTEAGEKSLTSSTGKVVSWTTTATAYAQKNDRGMQIGSSNNPQEKEWKISTPISSFGDNAIIRSIEVDLDANGTGSCLISVGTETSSEDDLTFDGVTTKSLNNLNVSSGNISISLSNATNALFFGGIRVFVETPLADGVTLSSLSIEDQTSNYIVGDSVSFDGKLVAHYSDETTAVVTPNEITISDDISSTTGSKTFSLSYSEGDVSLSLEVPVTITQPTTDIKISYDSKYIPINNAIALGVTFSPSDASDQSVTWSVDNEEIATIDENGNITGLQVGRVVVTITQGVLSNSMSLEVTDDTNPICDLIVEDSLGGLFIDETIDFTRFRVQGVYTDESITDYLDVTEECTFSQTSFSEASEEAEVVITYKNHLGTEISITTYFVVTERELSTELYVSPGDELGNEAKTLYSPYDTALDTTYVTIYATFVGNEGRSEDVTEKATLVTKDSDIDFTKCGTYEVSYSYTEDEITATGYYEITVTAAAISLNVNKLTKVTSLDDLNSGDRIILADVSKNTICSTSFGEYSFTFGSDDELNADYNSIVENCAVLTIDNDNEYIRFKDDSDKYLGSSNTGKGNIGFGKSNIDWTLTFDETTGKGTFANTKFDEYTLNHRASSKCFALYKGNYSLNVYKLSTVNSTDALFEAVKVADASLVCGSESNGYNGTYDMDGVKNALSGLTDEEMTVLKEVVAKQDGNIIESFLYKYDYLVSAGKIDDSLLNRGVASSSRTSLLFNNLNNDATIAIIVIVSLISVTSIGGFFFVKKQKEE